MTQSRRIVPFLVAAKMLLARAETVGDGKAGSTGNADPHAPPALARLEIQCIIHLVDKARGGYRVERIADASPRGTSA